MLSQQEALPESYDYKAATLFVQASQELSNIYDAFLAESLTFKPDPNISANQLLKEYEDFRTEKIKTLNEEISKRLNTAITKANELVPKNKIPSLDFLSQPQLDSFEEQAHKNEVLFAFENNLKTFSLQLQDDFRIIISEFITNQLEAHLEASMKPLDESEKLAMDIGTEYLRDSGHKNSKKGLFDTLSRFSSSVYKGVEKVVIKPVKSAAKKAYETAKEVVDKFGEWYALLTDLPKIIEKQLLKGGDDDKYKGYLTEKGPELCNGYQQLCDRRYNEAPSIVAHNATSLIKEVNIPKISSINFNIVADQEKVLAQQLHDGVRGFKFPIHDFKNEPYVCHTIAEGQIKDIQESLRKMLNEKLKIVPIAKLRKAFVDVIIKFFPLKVAQKNRCLLDRTHKELEEAFKIFKTWLDNHPYDILTVNLEMKIPLEDTLNALEKSGLNQYIQKQFRNLEEDFNSKEWPTLREMVEKNWRAVLFSTKDFSKEKEVIDRHPWAQYILKKNKLVYESPYDYRSVDKLRNEAFAIRGIDNPEEIIVSTEPNAYRDRFKAPRNKCFLIHHYVTPGAAGSRKEAKKANEYSFLLERAKKYYDKVGQAPTFIKVDFYDIPSTNNRPDVFRALNDIITWKPYNEVEAKRIMEEEQKQLNLQPISEIKPF